MQGIADLSNRITGQIPMVSMSSELQNKQVDFVCEKHGKVKAEVFRFYGDWSDPSCPKCAQEETQERERIQREWNERQRQISQRAALESRLKRSCIPPRFQEKHFGNYQPNTQAAEKILTRCKSYASQFPRYATHGISIIFCGHAGTGKTHLACAIANHILHHHAKSAVYMQAVEAFRMVKETYTKSSKQTERSAISWFKTPDLLILDEVGVQFGTDAERHILFEIINGRYEDMKPTLLISNLAVEGLVQYAGERVIDRMKENGGMMMVFDWNSHRGTANLSTPQTTPLG